MSTGSYSSGGVSFQANILPLFRPQDIACMKNMGVLLNDYAYMSQPENAQNVYDHLKENGATPRMPLGGPYWTPEHLGLFQTWMTETPPYQP
jgi:hypothetical protein